MNNNPNVQLLERLADALAESKRAKERWAWLRQNPSIVRDLVSHLRISSQEAIELYEGLVSEEFEKHDQAFKDYARLTDEADRLLIKRIQKNLQ